MSRKWTPTCQNKTAYAFLAPSLLGLLVFVLLPFADVIRRSFFQAVGGLFVGMDNYRQVLENGAFRQALGNTVRFLCICLPLLLALSFVAAVFLNSITGFARVLRAGFLLPMAIPVASVVVFWKLLFDQNGAVNQMLGVLHLTGQDWMNTGYAFWILVGSYLWKNMGDDIVLWIAALSAIPEEQYEAARVSGAGAFQCFRYITLPQMKGSIFLIGVLSFVNAFRVFREAYLIAGDYPHESIYMLQHLFNNWFTKLDIQKMSAAAVLMAIAVSVILVLVEWWNERQESSE